MLTKCEAFLSIKPRSYNASLTKSIFGNDFADKKGILHLLASSTPIEECIHETNVPNMYIIPSEGEIGQAIVHKNVVMTFEFGLTTANEQYILMEYVTGKGVNHLIKERNSKMVTNRLKLIRQMCHAIQAVHEAGFIHRDICPRNFIAAANVHELKLIDFGLTVPDKEPFRMPGNRTGTPQYMAPEIVRRRKTDLRVDVS